MSSDNILDKPNIDDSVKISRKTRDPIRNNDAGVLLKNFIKVMYSHGEEAEEEYQEILKEMRENAEDIIVEIIRAEGSSEESDYPFRWALVHIASELRHPVALPFLRSMVLSPIPPEKSRDPHSFSTVAEETILRTTAVEGVEYLAEKENREAKRALFEFLRINSISIRRAAVQGILATGQDKKVHNKMRAILPESMHFLLEIKRVEVQDVPQIEEPQRHLRDEVRDRDVKEPPRAPERRKGEAPRTYGRREE